MLLLRPAAWLYGGIVALRNRAYDRNIFTVVKTGVPVLSVGNIAAGGSGKTPLTEYIVRYLEGRKIKTGVLSRGYKRSTTGPRVVADGEQVFGNADECGDEPYQIARKFQSAIVVVDEDRVRGAQVMIGRFHPGCVVLDDGFQHRRIARDLDIVLIDGAEWQKVPELLPAGRLREPLSSLGRAGCVILMKSAEDLLSMKDMVQKYFRGPIFVAEKQPTSSVRISDGRRSTLADITHTSCIAFCGIAKPDSFRSTVSAVGFDIKRFRSYGDHYRYTAGDLNNLRAMKDQTGADMIVTTEKDAARIVGTEFGRIVDDRWCFIEIEMNFIEGETEFRQLIDRTVRISG